MNNTRSEETIAIIVLAAMAVYYVFSKLRTPLREVQQRYTQAFLRLLEKPIVLFPFFAVLALRYINAIPLWHEYQQSAQKTLSGSPDFLSMVVNSNPFPVGSILHVPSLGFAFAQSSIFFPLQHVIAGPLTILFAIFWLTRYLNQKAHKNNFSNLTQVAKNLVLLVLLFIADWKILTILMNIFQLDTLDFFQIFFITDTPNFIYQLILLILWTFLSVVLFLILPYFLVLDQNFKAGDFTQFKKKFASAFADLVWGYLGLYLVEIAGFLLLKLTPSWTYPGLATLFLLTLAQFSISMTFLAVMVELAASTTVKTELS